MKKAVKKIISLFMVICMLLSLTALVTFAEDKETYIQSKLKDAIVLSVGSSNAMVNLSKVLIDNNNRFVVPTVENGTTLVPIRFVSESLGLDVSWDEDTQTAKLTNKDTTIVFTIDNLVMLKNNEKIDLSVAPKKLNNRTLVPLRAISEALGKEVFYDRGLIIISDTKDIFDAKAEVETLDYIIMEKLGSLPSVDSYENYTALMSKYEQSDKQRLGGVVAGGGGSVGETGSGGSAPAPIPSSAPVPESTNKVIEDSIGTSGSDYSGTNVQVEGVDEADVIKTDGSFIYKVRQDKVSIVKAVPSTDMSLVSEIKFGIENYNPQEMYVDGNRLVVIGYYWKQYEMPADKVSGDVRIMPYPYYRSKSFVRVDIYDISDKANPVSIREAELEGNYISSRKIGDSLYFATNYYTYTYDPEGNPGEVQPLYRDSAVSADYSSLDFKCIRYFPHFTQTNYLNIAGLNVSDSSQKMQVESYLGGGNNLYVSLDNMFVAMQTYEVVESTEEITYSDNGEVKTAEVVRWDYSKPITKIFKFALNEGQINYVATGAVEGNILNQFSMDEYNGDFRIATTTWSREGQSNNLFILDSNMKNKSKITEIAPGERIYSVRFMGDMAYMVTFKQVDPLFVIDLSDPENPAILGQLKIPGYSDYLHPYDKTHIIGFGKDADADGRAMGMKMAIFDVSDFTNPKEMYSEYIGDRGTHSPLLYNHKALLFSKERNLLAFPVDLYEIPEHLKNNKNAYGMFKMQGLFVYDISLESGFNLRGTISHITDEELLKFGNVIQGSRAIVERGLYIGDSLYTISEFGIMANNLYTLEQEGFVNIN